MIKIEKDKDIQIGKLGNISFKKGYYVYIGSALNGLEQRINRHLKKRKKLHWHIDYLLRYGKIVNVFYKKSDKKEECKIAKKLDKKLPLISGFGCSDCNCNSHLFYGSKNDIVYVDNAFKAYLP